MIPLRSLDEIYAQIDQFDQDGYVVVNDIFSLD